MRSQRRNDGELTTENPMISATRLFLLLCFFPCIAATQNQQSNSPDTPRTMIEVQLRLNGLYPKAIAVTEGPFDILFTNAAFLVPFDLVLQDGNGQGIEHTSAGTNFRHRQTIRTTLHPGKYQFRVVGHPEWTADLTVSPKGK